MIWRSFAVFVPFLCPGAQGGKKWLHEFTAAIMRSGLHSILTAPPKCFPEFLIARRGPQIAGAFKFCARSRRTIPRNRNRDLPIFRSLLQLISTLLLQVVKYTALSAAVSPNPKKATTIEIACNAAAECSLSAHWVV